MAFQTFMKNFAFYMSPGPQGIKADISNSQTKFAEIIEREQARADRNGHGFSVISYEANNSDINKPYFRKLLNILPKRMRITDEIGWLDHQHIGLLLYSTTLENARNFACQIEKAIVAEEGVAPKHSIHCYPSSSDWSDSSGGGKDSTKKEQKNLVDSQDLILTANHKLPRWKRFVDIAGATCGLIISAPVFFFMAVFIKVVSPGPVFFKQVRVGFGGKHFMFWKFRTMKANVDTTAHQKLLAELIKGGDGSDGTDKPMAKLDHDPQIIPFGNFLRKTCIDELPQLLNVLCGDMSLIGPRPPIPYEVDEYDRWHKARLGTIPGMTGLWQISGKNRLTFKEMVRLDIRYLRKQSFWHDIKILLLTPKAIVSQVKDIL